MKKQLNYKLLNILLILGIIYLLFLMSGLWTGVVGKIINVLLPFIVAFGIAYVLYPFLKYLESKKLPKALGIILILLVILIIVGLVIYFVVPVFVNQLTNLLSSLNEISNDFANKYNIDMKVVNDTVGEYSTKMIDSLKSMISSGSIFGIINTSIDYISKTVITLIVSVYFLADMENIRKKVKEFIMVKSTKTYNLLSTIDNEIYSYLKGLGIFMIIQFFEYTMLFLIIGHPNFLLLGVLACITTIIPYFGGIITNVFALVIASVISPRLFILTLIITLIFPNIDGYVISPKIYGKTNQLPALLTIFAVTAGGVLFGFTGIVIAVPLTIILMAIVRAYKPDITNKIQSIKSKDSVK